MVRRPSRKTVGVIGGMGPQGTADFFSKLISLTPANEEREHLHVIIDNDPDVPSRIAAIQGHGPSPAPKLQSIARGLERAGAGFIVMPCNTAHAFATEIADAVSIPFLNMVEIVSDSVAKSLRGGEIVGLLAARGCIEAGLYQSSLRRRDLQTLHLPADRMTKFMEAVFSIKAKGPAPATTVELENQLHWLEATGAEAIIAACTEIPVALDCEGFGLPVLDATAILAEAAVVYAVSPTSL